MKWNESGFRPPLCTYLCVYDAVKYRHVHKTTLLFSERNLNSGYEKAYAPASNRLMSPQHWSREGKRVISWFSLLIFATLVAEPSKPYLLKYYLFIQYERTEQFIRSTIAPIVKDTCQKIQIAYCHLGRCWCCEQVDHTPEHEVCH